MIPFLLFSLPQTSDLTLFRGSELSGPFAGVKGRYWDVSEAEIDAQGPDSSIPTLFGLAGGAQRKVLLRFGSLDLATIRDSKIVEGTLTLALAEADKAALKSVKLVKKPWLSPGVNVLARKIQAPKNPKEIPFAAGVTWNKAGGDQSNWQSGGANGAADAENLDVKIEVVKVPSEQNAQVRISNLGPTLQFWKTHEGENYGLLLEFSSDTGFWSSTSPEARPRLDLKLEKAAVRDPHFSISNEAGTISLQSTEPIKTVDVYHGTKKVSSEKTTKVTLPTGNPSKDPRGGYVRIVASFEDASIPQEVVTIDPAAPWVKLSPSGSRLWNQWNVDQSFYSFAKYGALKHVNGEGDKDEAFAIRTEIEPLASSSNITDTNIIPGLVPPARSTRNPLFRQVGMVEGGPLTMAQVDYLMNGKLQMPKVTLAKVVNIDGRPIENVVLGMKTATSDTQDLKTEANGVLVLPKINDDLKGRVTFTASANGSTDSFEVPLAAFTNLYARGNVAASSLDLPFNLPMWPLVKDANLVAGKPTKDSAGSFPAQLVGLVDDSLDTTYTLPAKGWVEIDLGRDRTMGEITFQGDMPNHFKVVVYGTTDKVEQAMWWIDEIDAAKFRREYAVTGDLTYRPTPTTARYIRIENLTDAPAKLKGLQVFAAKKP